MEGWAGAEVQREANSFIVNVNQKAEAQRQVNTSIENNNQDAKLVKNIAEILESAEPSPAPECCIYRVPYTLRKLNPEAYTRQVISIGPYHHGKKRLQRTEKPKVRLFKRFLQRAELCLEDLVSTVKNWEGKIRHCYVETVRLSSDDFVKMVLVDASFIIELFLSIHSGIFEDKMLSLFNLSAASSSSLRSFTSLTCNFFEVFNKRGMDLDSSLEIKHFVDLLRIFHLPQSLASRSSIVEIKHLPSAIQLHEVGVKFEEGSSRCLLDVDFTKGLLKFPRLEIEDATESLFEIS